jgi:acylpyruvate hydrolase
MLCRKIIGVGWNYKKHAQELGSLLPKVPLLFLKPSSSIIQSNESIEIPVGLIVHHEGSGH